MRAASPQRGFTLLELLIAISLLVFMMVVAWSTVSVGATARLQAEAIQARNHEIRVAMNRMVADLSSAYISANEDQNLQHRRTLFVGDSASDVDDLMFSSFAHRTLWADANESEQTLITYSAEENAEMRGQTDLVRRESRRLSNESPDDEPAETDILLADIERVRFEYYDWRDKEWQETWDSRAADGERGRLPARVRVTIELERGDGETVKFVTQARPMLQEELGFFAN